MVAVALTLVFRFTRFGLATRAGAENETGAALIGISASWIAARNWMIATLLATVSGILITPDLVAGPDVLHAVRRARRSAPC